jgi:hypothetical protein
MQSFLDPLHFAIAVGPLHLYLLLLALINLLRRPVVVTGTRDTAALGVAVSGLVIVGPMELFVPQAAFSAMGAFVWVLLLGLYVLCLTLIVLLMRPRLVIYNATSDQIRPLLAGVMAELDKEARWAGDSLVLPQLGVQLYLESMALLRNVSLRSAGPNQNPQGWWQLESALGGVLASLEVPRNACGVVMAVLGAILSAVLLGIIAYDPQTVNRLLFEMLNV